MNLAFTYHEIIDLLKSFIGVSLIFWWVAGGIPAFGSLPIIALFVGLAFVLHELAHKAMASYYRYRAEYRSNDMMLLASMFLGFFGIIFLAPGAVVIEQVRKPKHMGVIAIVGPLTNILLALICAALIPFFPVAQLGFAINAWLALFNMLPIFGMDGQKVLAWSKVAFAVVIVFAGVLYLLTYL